jgi:hypothetical protein
MARLAFLQFLKLMAPHQIELQQHLNPTMGPLLPKAETFLLYAEEFSLFLYALSSPNYWPSRWDRHLI